MELIIRLLLNILLIINKMIRRDIAMSTNYSDQYEYYKKSGVEQPIVFLPIEKGPEHFVPITNLQVPDIMI